MVAKKLASLLHDGTINEEDVEGESSRDGFFGGAPPPPVEEWFVTSKPEAFTSSNDAGVATVATTAAGVGGGLVGT